MRAPTARGARQNARQSATMKGPARWHSVPVVDRPREKLARVGAEALGDNELVALVLGTGTRSRGALIVAQDVLDAAGGVQGLVRLGIDELCRVPGVGESRAARLLAAVELGRRTLSAIAASGRRCCRRRTSASIWCRGMRASASSGLA